MSCNLYGSKMTSVLSEKSSTNGCDDCPFCLFSPASSHHSGGSSRVIGNSQMFFIGVVEASLTATGLNLDNKLELGGKLHSITLVCWLPLDSR